MKQEEEEQEEDWGEESEDMRIEAHASEIVVAASAAATIKNLNDNVESFVAKAKQFARLDLSLNSWLNSTHPVSSSLNDATLAFGMWTTCRIGIFEIHFNGPKRAALKLR